MKEISHMTKFLPNADPPPVNLDLEAVLQYLTSTHNAEMAQLRSVSNMMARLLETDLGLQADIKQLIKVLDHTRESRYTEEIQAMEQQLAVLHSQLEGKKNARVDMRTTSERVRTITKEEIAADIAARSAKTRINWQAVRQTMVQAVAAALAVGFILGLLGLAPEIGQAIKLIFGG
jgi:hypothetical protein